MYGRALRFLLLVIATPSLVGTQVDAEEFCGHRSWMIDAYGVGIRDCCAYAVIPAQMEAQSSAAEHLRYVEGRKAVARVLVTRMVSKMVSSSQGALPGVQVEIVDNPGKRVVVAWLRDHRICGLSSWEDLLESTRDDTRHGSRLPEDSVRGDDDESTVSRGPSTDEKGRGVDEDQHESLTSEASKRDEAPEKSSARGVTEWEPRTLSEVPSDAPEKGVSEIEHPILGTICSTAVFTDSLPSPTETLIEGQVYCLRDPGHDLRPALVKLSDPTTVVGISRTSGATHLLQVSRDRSVSRIFYEVCRERGRWCLVSETGSRPNPAIEPSLKRYRRSRFVEDEWGKGFVLRRTNDDALEEKIRALWRNKPGRIVGATRSGMVVEVDGMSLSAGIYYVCARYEEEGGSVERYIQAVGEHD